MRSYPTGDAAEHDDLGRCYLHAERGRRAAVLRERDQRRPLSGHANATPYVKDGINDHVVQRAPDGEPDGDGHEGRRPTYGHRRSPARRRHVRVRLTRRADPSRSAEPFADFDDVVATRRAEADEFYDSISPASRSATTRGR